MLDTVLSSTVSTAVPSIKFNLHSDDLTEIPYLCNVVDVSFSAYEHGFRVPVLLTDKLFKRLLGDIKLSMLLKKAATVIRDVFSYNQGRFVFNTFKYNSLERQENYLKLELVTVQQELVFIIGLDEEFN